VWAGGAEREAAAPHPMNLMRTLPKYLTQDELTRFFAAIDSLRDRALFAVIYHYGLRVDEATHLGIDDLNLKDHRIRIRRLKNGVGGERPLWRHTARPLRAYLRVRKAAGPYLFTGREGPLNKRMVQQLFKDYAKKAGITGRSIHALRHSIAVHLLEAGRGIEYVADHLGHRNIQNTKVYAQITNPLREQVFRDLEQHPKIVRLS
jgi:integrase/recombinase XerD